MTYKSLNKLIKVTILALRRNKLLAIGLVVAVSLSIGGTTYAYQQFFAPKKPTITDTKVTDKLDTKKDSTKTTTPTVATTASASQDSPQPTTKQASTTKPTPAPVKSTRRRADSTNPAWLACVNVQSQQYVAYQQANASKNVEKSAALAEFDRMYHAGEFADYGDPGVPLTQEEQDSVYQDGRPLLIQQYNDELMTIYTNYAAQQQTQQALCDATYDHQ